MKRNEPKNIYLLGEKYESNFFETAVRIKISEIKNLLKLLFSFSKQKNKIIPENLLGPRAVPQK